MREQIDVRTLGLGNSVICLPTHGSAGVSRARRLLGNILALCFTIPGLGSLLPGLAHAQLNPRLSIADREYAHQSPDQVQARFDQYRQLGIGTLRTSITWRNEEPDGSWQYQDEKWMELAVRNGFKLKLNISTISSPPGWFLDAHPEARIVDESGEYPRNMISYWYPGLHQLVQTRTERTIRYLAAKHFLAALDSVIVDLGPQGEPHYPTPTNLGGQGHRPEFWFYDANAQRDFREKMRTKYGEIAIANAKWGSRFPAWEAVAVPREHTVAGPFWEDVLLWYRDSKREFVAWQIGNIKQILQRYVTPQMPHLIILIPGRHLSRAEWIQAIQTGSGDPMIHFMTDSEFLLQIASKTGLFAQYTGLGPSEAEIAYLEQFNRANSLNVPIWGENTGDLVSASSPMHLADMALKYGLYGLEYVWAGFVLQPDGRPTAIWPEFQQACAKLRVAINPNR